MLADILPQLNNKPYFEDLKTDYEILFCPVTDVDKLIEFIDSHWRKDHPFVLSRELFDWQHFDKKNNRYNFIIAKHKASGEIHSILGFLPTSQFDPEIQHLKIWPCIWKVREDIKVKGLGTYLYCFLKNELPVQTLSILGISEIALSIYQHWGFSTGKIQHYYMLNESKERLELVLNQPTTSAVSEDTKTNTPFIDLSVEDFEKLPDSMFASISKFKSKTYYINRFYKHPIYKYMVKGTYQDGELSNVLFLRNCPAKSSSALRIVDFIGKEEGLSNNQPNFSKLLTETGADYLDFVNVGLNSDNLKRAGFNNKADSSIVLANYFEPYLQENIELDYAHKTVASDDQLTFVKGDSDQDRPNLIQ